MGTQIRNIGKVAGTLFSRFCSAVFALSKRPLLYFVLSTVWYLTSLGGFTGIGALFDYDMPTTFFRHAYPGEWALTAVGMAWLPCLAATTQLHLYRLARLRNEILHDVNQCDALLPIAKSKYMQTKLFTSRGALSQQLVNVHATMLALLRTIR